MARAAAQTKIKQMAEEFAVVEEKRQATKPLSDPPQWLTWKAGPKDEAGKFPKYPQNIHTGRPATGIHEARTYLENCGALYQANEAKKKHGHTGLQHSGRCNPWRR